jgi:hypothetical protein
MSHRRSALCQKLMADHWRRLLDDRSGNVWDNAAMESFFSSLGRVDELTIEASSGIPRGNQA